MKKTLEKINNYLVEANDPMIGVSIDLIGMEVHKAIANAIQNDDFLSELRDTAFQSKSNPDRKLLLDIIDKGVKKGWQGFWKQGR